MKREQQEAEEEDPQAAEKIVEEAAPEFICKLPSDIAQKLADVQDTIDSARERAAAADEMSSRLAVQIRELMSDEIQQKMSEHQQSQKATTYAAQLEHVVCVVASMCWSQEHI